MNRDSEWLKWVGLSIAISILVAVYFVKSDKNKINQDVQVQADQGSTKEFK